MKQQYEKYTAENREIWKLLFSRQHHNLRDKASGAYLAALYQMKEVLHAGEIPNFDKMDRWFENHTKWTIKCVPGLIPVEDFFELLANKQFCSSTWLRELKNLDYLEEPDMFHDTFGHIPLLSNPVFSDFLHEFGKLGVAVQDDKQKLLQLQRLYWFTIEFGLILENNQLKVYGAGIASSFGETNLCVGYSVSTAPFDLKAILDRPFETDHVQNYYFVIGSYQQLFDAILELKKQWVPAEMTASI